MNTEQYISMPKEALLKEQTALQQKYNAYQAQKLNLNMARGKPGPEQLELSMPMLNILHGKSELYAANGDDCRNYGLLEGLPEMRQFFGDLLGVDAWDVIVGGNSSLNMMFDTVDAGMHYGFSNCKPWAAQGKLKFLCPCPGYDRHFGLTEYFGIEMIIIPMTEQGPDMDMVEQLVSSDTSIKAIWCVPKYSNPQGITYSDEVVRRFATLKPAAKDFKILWDNAYCVHDISDTPDNLLNLMKECKKQGSDDLPIIFTSTSKITFPGAGVAAMAGSKNTLATIRKKLALQTIGYDKINQLRHLLFLKALTALTKHKEQLKALIRPKFDMVLNTLKQELTSAGFAHWTNPQGGYFVSVNVMEGCAKRVVTLCKEAGVTLTDAGATYPYGKDPNDCNIRIAPTFPSIEELKQAMDIFCIAAKLAALEHLLTK